MNVYNCSSEFATELPASVPTFTNELVVYKTNLTNLCQVVPYISSLSFLDVRRNNISKICKSFAQNLGYNLVENKNRSSQLRRVMLSENPFSCNCDIIWMIKWLSNFTTEERHVIADYRNIKCSGGLMNGKHIYLLNPIDMGCFPSKWTFQQKIGVGLGAGLAILMIIGLTFLVIKRSRDIRFFLFYYCKCFHVPGDERNEPLQNMSNDAYLCYR